MSHLAKGQQSSPGLSAFTSNSLNSQMTDRWAVILAGGEGKRLRTLTQLIAGDERPTQFCAVLGEETLLDQTRSRGDDLRQQTADQGTDQCRPQTYQGKPGDL